MNGKKTTNDVRGVTQNDKKTTLIEQLHEKAATTHPARGSAMNLALFLANKEEIEQAIKAGWNSKLIWQTLRESKKFIGGYECFRRYVRLYVQQKQPANPSSEAHTQPPSVLSSDQPVQQKQVPADKFQFTANPDDTDLI